MTNFPNDEYAGKLLIVEFKTQLRFTYPINYTGADAISQVLRRAMNDLSSGIAGIIPESITFSIEPTLVR